MHKKAYGFTIIELLIVLLVISILVSIVVVSYIGIQNRAAETRLQADLKAAAAALSTKKVATGSFPASDPSGNPPADITTSDGTTFEYSAVGDGYCLTATSSRAGVSAYRVGPGGTISKGICSGHNPNRAHMIALNCPAGFIVVPGNSHYGTSDFCVMKYEARNVGGVPTSQAAGLPWASISQTNAITVAQTACDGCRLISEAQWMTLATNLISVPSNWTGGAMGSGVMYQGHTDNSPTGAVVASSDDNDGYAETGNVAPSNQRRTLTLTNGEVIWDVSGNVWEWTSDTITGGQPGLAGETTYNYKNYTDAIQWNGFPSTSRPTGTLYPRSKGVGGIHSNPTDTTLRTFARGGAYNNATTGVLNLSTSWAPTHATGAFSFRVVKS